MLQRIGELSTLLTQAEANRLKLQSRYEFLTSPEADPVAYFLDRPGIQKVHAALVDLRASRATLGDRLGSRHPQMVEIALRHRPHSACLVPERRAERTTEGGLDAAGQLDRVRAATARLAGAGIKVSLFVEPDARQLEASIRAGAPAVELHTGTYCEAEGAARAAELARLATAAREGVAGGLLVHAGHGLAYDTVGAVAAIPEPLPFAYLSASTPIWSKGMAVGLLCLTPAGDGGTPTACAGSGSTTNKMLTIVASQVAVRRTVARLKTASISTSWLKLNVSS